MKYITMDMSRTSCKCFEEELVVAMSIALNEPEAIVRWNHPSTGLSFCVSYGESFLKISVGSIKNTVPSRYEKFFKQLLGEPAQFSRRVSSLDQNQEITYFRWHSGVCDELKEALEMPIVQ